MGFKYLQKNQKKQKNKSFELDIKISLIFHDQVCRIMTVEFETLCGLHDRVTLMKT